MLWVIIEVKSHSYLFLKCWKCFWDILTIIFKCLEYPPTCTMIFCIQIFYKFWHHFWNIYQIQALISYDYCWGLNCWEYSLKWINVSSEFCLTMPHKEEFKLPLTAFLPWRETISMPFYVTILKIPCKMLIHYVWCKLSL